MPAQASTIKEFPVLKPANIKQKAAIQAVPAERPSILSSRLKALVTPTIQTKIKAKLIIDQSNSSKNCPPATNKHVITI